MPYTVAYTVAFAVTYAVPSTPPKFLVNNANKLHLLRSVLHLLLQVTLTGAPGYDTNRSTFLWSNDNVQHSQRHKSCCRHKLGSLCSSSHSLTKQEVKLALAKIAGALWFPYISCSCILCLLRLKRQKAFHVISCFIHTSENKTKVLC